MRSPGNLEEEALWNGVKRRAIRISGWGYWWKNLLFLHLWSLSFGSFENCIASALSRQVEVGDGRCGTWSRGLIDWPLSQDSLHDSRLREYAPAVSPPYQSAFLRRLVNQIKCATLKEAFNRRCHEKIASAFGRSHMLIRTEVLCSLSPLPCEGMLAAPDCGALFGTGCCARVPSWIRRNQHRKTPLI